MLEQVNKENYSTVFFVPNTRVRLIQNLIRSYIMISIVLCLIMNILNTILRIICLKGD